MVYPKQNASVLLMIRPASFGYNTETAQNNAFQSIDDPDDPGEIKLRALREFDFMVDQLKQQGQVDLLVLEDTPDPPKPDALFPNNWLTTHNSGKLVTWPMFSPLRRLERRSAILDELANLFQVTERESYVSFETEGKFLEGTGSLVLDRINRIAYACLSERTHPDLLDLFARNMGYSPLPFLAVDLNGEPVYHTNVVMSVGERFVVICLEAVTLDKDRRRLRQQFEKSGKEVIEISLAQMHAFAGNILQVLNLSGKFVIVISASGFHSLNTQQKSQLAKHGEILTIPLETIEKYGGGSARCMLAEIFLEKKAI